MAIAFSRVSVHSRSQGHSAVAGAAYRSGTKLFDARTGETHDFTNKGEVIYSTILLPEGADSEFKDREYLWNQVEASEKRKDSQVAKDIILALPKEIDTKLQIDLARQFAQDHFVRHGLVADIAIHNHGDGNPHAHIYVTTRRLSGHEFGLKARDLNPEFARGRVASQDAWGEKWRESQEAFFKKHGLHLEVDANYIVSQRHEGCIRNGASHYTQHENQERKEASVTIALNDPVAVLNILARSKGVFTEKDAAKLLFKNTDSQEQYDTAMRGLFENKELVSLGPGDDGAPRFTSRGHFNREYTTQRDSVELSKRKQHDMKPKSLQKVLDSMTLNPEQTKALSSLAQPEDLSVLIGRAGTGKSYLMKAAHDAWTDSGYRVMGVSVSGIAAKGLQESSGIQSYTIASFKNRIAYAKKPDLLLNKNDILVMDEAGMTDSYDMSLIVEMAKASGCKLVLVGDENQLQPIGAGAPLRAIVSDVGFSELSSIMRQKDLGDRNASQLAAQGDIKGALLHYESKGALQWHSSSQDTQHALIHTWQQGLTNKSLHERLILAHQNVDVEALNLRARDAVKEKGLLSHQDIHVKGFNQQELTLAVGDRILFRKNDKALGVANGEFATIKKISNATITATIDQREVTFSAQDYSEISYGYAATVHKAQGITVNHAYVYLGGKCWNKHLSYVAFSRHRNGLHLFASKDTHRDLSQLTKTLSRSETKDNVVDYPVSFAMRRGFDPESVVGRFVNHVSSIAEKIKDKWQYLTDYEAYCQKQSKKEALQEKVTARKHKNVVADYQYAHREVGRRYSQMHKDKVVPTVDKDLKELLTLRNKLAQEIVKNKSIYQSSIETLNIDEKALKKAVDIIEKKPEKAALPEKIDWDQLEGIKGSQLETLKGLGQRIEKASPRMKDIYIKEFQSISSNICQNTKLISKINERSPSSTSFIKQQALIFNKEKGRDR